jgi:MYXO-CTERM domain-containing protein
VFVTVDDAGTNEIAGDTEFAVIDQSIQTWNDDTASCSYMVVKDAGRKAIEVGKDHVNVIKFRDSSWCRPAVGTDAARCYAHDSAGITTATYIDDATSSRDGAIVDADIEINGVDFSIAVNHQTLGTAPCQSELQNTLTHELGHLHGLEHTCTVPGDPSRIDGSGNPVPSCATSMNNPAITEPTMYNFQDCGETKKETLETDDINSMCVIYPPANDPKTCEPVTLGGCCSTGRDGPNPWVPLGLSGLVGALVLLRRPKSRRAL